MGWDRDRRYQLDALAAFAGVDVEHLELVGDRLEAAGLLERHGRYRALSPLPVAVLLSADAWASEGARIVDELLPSLDPEMARSLYRRCADLGRYGPARDVLNRLLAYDGSFGSLESIENEGTADVLVQLAIVMPERTARHLSELIGSETLDRLRSFKRSRRSIVNALEKLVWHPETFEPAADAMLRLALAENETWANNATGQFSSIFGARLPATAASPEERAAYLTRLAAREQAEVRALAARAAASALAMREFAVVSGELQGGAVAAPRGTAQGGEQTTQYLLSMVGVLDSRPRCRRGCRCRCPVGPDKRFGPFLAVPQVGRALATCLSSFRGESLKAVRRALEDAERHSKDQAQIDAGRRLEGLLPQGSPEERLRELLGLSPWARQVDPAKSSEFDELVGVGIEEGWIRSVLQSLQEAPVESAWHLGRALGAREMPRPMPELIADAAEVDAPALAGYLRARVDAGDSEAFDHFFERSQAESLSASTGLYLSAAGPTTEVARARMMSLAQKVPVSEAAGWSSGRKI